MPRSNLTPQQRQANRQSARNTNPRALTPQQIERARQQLGLTNRVSAPIVEENWRRARGRKLPR